MQVGDLVRRSTGARAFCSAWEVCIVVDTVTQTSASSAGCKKYVVLSPSGDKSLRWLGELEVINENR
jgi:hypothetical protein